jgi:hypothetical protein
MSSGFPPEGAGQAEIISAGGPWGPTPDFPCGTDLTHESSPVYY